MITLKTIIESLSLTALTGTDKLDAEINRGYMSDLLSDVVANAQKGDIWITLQIHQNIVAVASLKEVAGIIIIGGRKPDSVLLEKAEAEGIPILSTGMPAFELAGKLFAMGIGGIDAQGR